MTDLPPLDDAAALFLDFDGVLVDFAPAPDLVKPEDYVVPVLGALQLKLGGALAVVTGRPLADVDRFLAPLKFTAAGQHGREIRLPGQEATEALPPDLDAEFEAVQAFVKSRPGTASERKTGSVGLHYRQAPEHGEDARRLMGDLLAKREDLALMSGKMIYELKEKGVHKGLGVRTLMALEPFAGRTPIFVGDDVTDEDGFRAVQEIGGIGIKVGEGETAAKLRADDLHAVHDWLRGAVA